MDDKEEAPLKQIRTFQGDVAEALQKQRESLISIQQTERLKHPGRATTATSLENAKKRKEFFYLLLGSSLLFVLGTIGTWYAYNEFVRKTAAPPSTAPANRFVSANSEIDLDLTDASRETLIKTISDAVKSVPGGELRHLILKKVVENESELLLTGDLLNILKSRAPGSLVRAFDPLFMFGALGESAFLIIKLASFENAFAGMLAWEKNLSQDIGPLLATAEFLRNIPPESLFTDVTDRNKDIRVLAFEDLPVLLYSFLDNNKLIITDNIETLKILIDRLTQEKLSR